MSMSVAVPPCHTSKIWPPSQPMKQHCCQLLRNVVMRLSVEPFFRSPNGRLVPAMIVQRRITPTAVEGMCAETSQSVQASATSGETSTGVMKVIAI
jgi:hypothetical protein